MKRKINFVLSIVLFLGLTLPMASVNAYYGGHANGKDAIISASEWGVELAKTSLVTDNDESTSVSLKGGQYLTIDLGKENSVSGIKIKANDSGSNGMRVTFYDSNKTVKFTFGTHSKWAYPTGADGAFKTLTDRNETVSNVRYVTFLSTNDVNLSEIDVFDSFTEPTDPGPGPVDPDPTPEADRAILVVTLITGLEKEYDLSMSEVNAFINWYDSKDNGVGPSKYAINKHNNNKGPFSKRTDYIVFNNILTFEVNEYTVTSATYN